jgi:hypothetical protein
MQDAIIGTGDISNISSIDTKIYISLKEKLFYGLVEKTLFDWIKPPKDNIYGNARIITMGSQKLGDFYEFLKTDYIKTHYLIVFQKASDEFFFKLILKKELSKNILDKLALLF